MLPFYGDELVSDTLLPGVEDVLKDETIVKVGWSLENDIRALRDTHGVLIRNVIDVQLAFQEKHPTTPFRYVHIDGVYMDLRNNAYVYLRKDPTDLYTAIGIMLDTPVVSKKDDKSHSGSPARNMTTDEWLNANLEILAGDIEYAKNDVLFSYVLYEHCNEHCNTRVGLRRYI